MSTTMEPVYGPYFAIYNTEIYDYNTVSYKSSYLSVYDPAGLTWKIELIEKHKPHSLFVDVTGETDQLCGWMLHVTENSTGKTEFCYGKVMVSGKKAQLI